MAVTGGAPSARFSDGTAAVLRLESKEPKGERPAFRINSDLFQTTIGAEGPLNRKRTATALVSVRKSYLQYLVSRLGHSDLGLGYQDVNAKITYDGGPRHRLTALIIDGSTSADGSDRESERLFETFVKGHHRADSGQFTWSWVPRPRAFVRNSFSWGRQVEDQRNFTGVHLLDATAQQAGLRSDVSFEWTEGHTIESGVEARTSGQEYARFAAWDPVTKTPGGHLSAVSDFNARVWQTGAYLQETWTRAGRWQITAGGRVDRLNYTSEVVWQPRAGLSLALSRRLRWTTSFGRFVRFPDLVELRGPFPNPSLRAERTTNFETGLALQATHGTVLRVDLYDRYIRQMPYSEQTEWRMSGERTLWPLFGAPLRDTLRGYSRGLEIVVERQGANRVAGRVSYSYGHARNDDTATGMHFDADFDQRHSVQAYAGYRLSASVNLSGRFRASSGVPIAGFYRGVADMPEQQFRLSEQRNQVRTSVYQRLDLRLDKAWYRHRSKITVYGEVSTILNRRQWRYYSFDQVPFGTAWGWLHRDRMLPILPAGGVTIEF